jgi:glycosyltransferase involved in cell wall biosynthesis
MDGPFGVAARAPLSRIALIGNALPRRCGLATYTSHVFDALRERYPMLRVDFHAINDPGQTYDYPASVTGEIRQEEIGDYASAADEIEARGAGLVWIQHEFGIFGGPSGAHLLRLVERLTIPVAITLHTVVERPSAEQRMVMERLIRASELLIVMAEKGRAILKARYGVPDRKILVIPHGVPDRPFTRPAAAKADFGLAGRNVLMTFGLLSPNKGIETMIEALPAIVAAHPDTDYVVAGATHPHLIVREGERYRSSLKALAERLGVADRLHWVDRFLDQQSLLDLLAAADIYITPYRGLEQITSGTLSYAVALGKPVISTPYHHAVEIIGPGNGILVEPGASAAFAAGVCRLLDDAPLRQGMAQSAYAIGRSMLWRRNVETAMAAFAACARAGSRATPGNAGALAGEAAKPQFALG